MGKRCNPATCRETGKQHVDAGSLSETERRRVREWGIVKLREMQRTGRVNVTVEDISKWREVLRPRREVLSTKAAADSAGKTSLTLGIKSQDSMQGRCGHGRGVVHCRRNIVCGTGAVSWKGQAYLRSHSMWCRVHVAVYARVKGQESRVRNTQLYH